MKDTVMILRHEIPVDEVDAWFDENRAGYTEAQLEKLKEVFDCHPIKDRLEWGLDVVLCPSCVQPYNGFYVNEMCVPCLYPEEFNKE